MHAYHEGADRCLDVADSPRAKARGARGGRPGGAAARVRRDDPRACAQVAMWWAPTWNAPHGALTRLLFGRPARRARTCPSGAQVGEDRRRGRRGAARGGLSRARSGSSRRDDRRPRGTADRRPPSLGRRPFDRELDTAWRRTSYSGLIRAEEQLAHGASSEPEQPGTDDEPSDRRGPRPCRRGPMPGPSTTALVSPMDGLAGRGHLRLAGPRRARARRPAGRRPARRAARAASRRSAAGGRSPRPPRQLADALLPMQHTPLGPLADDLTLAGHRAGATGCASSTSSSRWPAGTPPSRRVRNPGRLPLADVRAARCAGTSPERPGACLRRPARQPVARRPGAARLPERLDRRGAPRAAIGADHALRRRGLQDQLARRPDQAADRAGLHRRPRSPRRCCTRTTRCRRCCTPWCCTATCAGGCRGYDPQRHLGGVLYLYVRGMVGPETPVVDGVPCGVFSWRPPARAGRGAVRDPRREGPRRDHRSDRGAPEIEPTRPERTGAARHRPAAAVQRAEVLEAADVHVAAAPRRTRRRGRRAGPAGGRARGARGPRSVRSASTSTTVAEQP